MHENQIKKDKQIMAGVDEVGRGPLAGPVIAAAVILDINNPISGLDDSKKLSEKKRTKLSDEIKCNARAWSIGRAEVEEIDELNILQASLLAMKRAVEDLKFIPDIVYVDGKFKPDIEFECEAVINGDSLVEEISAASIIAKVTRDIEMCELDKVYSGYGFSRHKGYPTKQHIESLQKLGVSRIHRRSFSPVKKIMKDNLSV